MQGKKELEDFSIEEDAGGMYKNVTKKFTTSVTNNKLEIHLYWSGKGSMFVPKQYGPLISAISVSAGKTDVLQSIFAFKLAHTHK